MMGFTLMLACAIGLAAGNPQRGAQRISVHVRSAWSGLGGELILLMDGQLIPQPPPPPTDFAVTCSLDDCPEPVGRLLVILEGAAKPKLEFRDFDSVVSWLRSADPDELRGSSGYAIYSRAPQAIRAALDEIRADAAAEVEQTLTRYYVPGIAWSDDYPFVAATICLPDGRTIQVESSSQKAFMLPWEVTVDGSAYQTFEPEIGRALAALAPPRFQQLSRLRGDGLKPLVVDAIYELAIRKGGKRE